jgi:hypothetical protein
LEAVILEIKYEPIDLDKALKKLKGLIINQNIKKLKKLAKKVTLLTLEKDHIFWSSFYSYFKVDNKYDPDDVQRFFQIIELKVKDKDLISHNEINSSKKAVKFLGIITKLVRTTITINPKQIKGPKIVEIFTLDSIFD